ncbi:hypothetical protein [Actinoplanes sp. NPDC020271]|uniref:hypothetical protein n=1 Tax=Actinoplanes sp. NPDC020271 TaxID=3363896 RepID=UPI00378CCCAE
MVDQEFDRLCRTVYVAARSGSLNCADAFDLAASVLEWKRTDPVATELALSSLDGVNRSRTAELALALLAEIDFQPGFAEEPEWLARVEDAMRVLNRDVIATGLRQECRLVVRDDEFGLNGNAYPTTWNGYSGTGQGVFPSAGADPITALVAVADDAQDAVMHMLWAAWPVCPGHERGVHARGRDGAAVWWCSGDGGHAVAAIGAWPHRAVDRRSR